ncbi:hypothetical protein NC653_025324 [Populus alba x Populus x berolinensis]|uniref:Pentatricopeptide repeat-containing protein n=1 Tax=Populus alba x Populus x berolinensis TaxID=444605 RepID=A0AAD6MAX4_9ROSI|nr:hypothetical protein NC653_025324 [Populus alba x Populus x berolinensis]
MPNKDVMSWKTVLNDYASNGAGTAWEDCLKSCQKGTESWLQGKCYVGNALMDMYAKCGVVETAFDVFKSMDKKDLISWNTIIGGLAVHGYGADAFKLFSRTKSAGGNLDLITIIGILCACTHMGLGEDGLSYFKSMTDNIQLRLRLNTMVVLMIWSLGSSCGFHQKEAHRRRFLFGLHCLGRVGFIKILNLLNWLLENSLNLSQRTLQFL